MGNTLHKIVASTPIIGGTLAKHDLGAQLLTPKTGPAPPTAAEDAANSTIGKYTAAPSDPYNSAVVGALRRPPPGGPVSNPEAPTGGSPTGYVPNYFLAQGGGATGPGGVLPPGAPMGNNSRPTTGPVSPGASGPGAMLAGGSPPPPGGPPPGAPNPMMQAGGPNFPRNFAPGAVGFGQGPTGAPIAPNTGAGMPAPAPMPMSSQQQLMQQMAQAQLLRGAPPAAAPAPAVTGARGRGAIR